MLGGAFLLREGGRSPPAYAHWGALWRPAMLKPHGNTTKGGYGWVWRRGGAFLWLQAPPVWRRVSPEGGNFGPQAVHLRLSAWHRTAASSIHLLSQTTCEWMHPT